jgi:hypothetical protein
MLINRSISGMTISDFNEKGYCYQLVMLVDRVYHFSDVNEKGNHYQLVLLIDRGYLVMQMNWPIMVMGKLHKLIK